MQVIDLTSPAGNAFALIGAVREAARQAGMDEVALVDELRGCATYAQLLDTIDQRLDGCFFFVNDPRLPGPSSWLVTYYNPVTEKRHVLIDNIDERTADAVLARFGDKADAFHRLPEVRKELATGGAA